MEYRVLDPLTLQVPQTEGGICVPRDQQNVECPFDANVSHQSPSLSNLRIPHSPVDANFLNDAHSIHSPPVCVRADSQHSVNIHQSTLDTACSDHVGLHDKRCLVCGVPYGGLPTNAIPLCIFCADGTSNIADVDFQRESLTVENTPCTAFPCQQSFNVANDESLAPSKNKADLNMVARQPLLPKTPTTDGIVIEGTVIYRLGCPTASTYSSPHNSPYFAPNRSALSNRYNSSVRTLPQRLNQQCLACEAISYTTDFHNIQCEGSKHIEPLKTNTTTRVLATESEPNMAELDDWITQCTTLNDDPLDPSNFKTTDVNESDAYETNDARHPVAAKLSDGQHNTRQAIRPAGVKKKLQPLKSRYTRPRRPRAVPRELIFCIVETCTYSQGTGYRGFRQRADARRHIQSMHRGRRYFCPVPRCRTSYSREDNFKSHMRRIHDIFDEAEINEVVRPQKDATKEHEVTLVDGENCVIVPVYYGLPILKA